MHTFHLRVGEMTPTLQDVVIMIGLLIDKTFMTNNKGLIDIDLLCDRLLGQVPPTNTYRGDCIRLTWLGANFNTLIRRDNKPANYVCLGMHITHV